MYHRNQLKNNLVAGYTKIYNFWNRSYIQVSYHDDLKELRRDAYRLCLMPCGIAHPIFPDEPITKSFEDTTEAELLSAAVKMCDLVWQYKKPFENSKIKTVRNFEELNLLNQLFLDIMQIFMAYRYEQAFFVVIDDKVTVKSSMSLKKILSKKKNRV